SVRSSRRNSTRHCSDARTLAKRFHETKPDNGYLQHRPALRCVNWSCRTPKSQTAVDSNTLPNTHYTSLLRFRGGEASNEAVKIVIGDRVRRAIFSGYVPQGCPSLRWPARPDVGGFTAGRDNVRLRSTQCVGRNA